MLQDKYSNLGMLSDSLVGICGKFGIHVRLVHLLVELANNHSFFFTYLQAFMEVL